MKRYFGAGILFWYPDLTSGNVSVLLGKRKYGFDRGSWSIPGGGWEKVDGFKDSQRDLEKTAIRESKEEIHFDVREKRFLMRIWSKRSILYNWDTFSVRCRKKIYIKKFSSEFSKVRWFSVDDLPKNRSMFVDEQIDNLLTAIRRKKG